MHHPRRGFAALAAFLSRAIVLAAPFPAACAAGEPPPVREQSFEAGRTRLTVRVPRGRDPGPVNREPSAPRLIAFSGDGTLHVGSHSGAVHRLSPRRAQALEGLRRARRAAP